MSILMYTLTCLHNVLSVQYVWLFCLCVVRMLLWCFVVYLFHLYCRVYCLHVAVCLVCCLHVMLLLVITVHRIQHSHEHPLLINSLGYASCLALQTLLEAFVKCPSPSTHSCTGLCVPNFVDVT